MADGLTTTTTVSTIPNATKIVTDDCGAAGHVQVVKLAVATDGDATILAPATSTLQSTGNTSLSSIDGKITAVNTGAVTVASSALPTGAATFAEQQTQTTSLGGILTSANFAAAFGTAGTADTQVMSVQGIASMTPLLVTEGSGAAAAASLSVMDDWDNGASDGASISGDVAHDTADAGEPVKIGGKALDLGATPTAVTANDRTNASFLRNGVQVVLGGSVDVVTLEAAYAASAQTDTALVTVSAGTAIVVTQIQVVADEANTVGVGFRVGFGTANTPTTTGVVLTHPGLVPGSGVSRGDGAGILGIGASNEDLRITSESATSGSIRVLVTYFTIAIG